MYVGTRLPSTLTSEILDACHRISPVPWLAGTAVFNRGPMDGQQHAIEADTAELCVVMTDGQQHRYRRTEEVQPLPDGRMAVIFDWAGGSYGPK